jgi:hypothetical protein
MIASNELRKGNFVTVDGTVCFVTQIMWDKVEVKPTSGDADYRQCAYDEIQPIPATTQILEKCKLEKQERFHYSNVFKKGSFTINQLRDDIEVSFGISSNPAIIFKGNLNLHQMQNLYFALVGEELMIEFK